MANVGTEREGTWECECGRENLDRNLSCALCRKPHPQAGGREKQHLYKGMPGGRNLRGVVKPTKPKPSRPEAA